MSQHQPFRTKLDYSDNRQIKQRQRTFTDLEGGTVFGVAFSALTSGPGPECSAVTETNSVLTGNTFSSNTFTTNYVWSDPRLTAIEPYLSAWTTTNSGTTQQVGNLFFASNTTVIDGNTVVLEYTGVSAEDVYVTTMTQVGASAYTGNVTINIFEVLSACSLDYTGRTIWVDNPEITRTKKLIVTNNATPGYVLTCYDTEGLATWQPSSGASADTNTFLTGTSLDCAGGLFRITRNDGVNIDTDLSCLKFTGNTSGDCISDLYVSNIHSCSPLNINPLDEGNIYMGSSSGLTFDVSNSRVGIGTTTPNSILEVAGTTNAESRIIVSRYVTSSGGPGIQFRKARGTEGSPIAVQNGDNLLNLAGSGYNGSSFFNQSATIVFDAAENFSGSQGGTDMIFGTTSLGATVSTEKMRISAEDYIYMGISSGLTYDITNKRLGMGIGNPSHPIDILAEDGSVLKMNTNVNDIKKLQLVGLDDSVTFHTAQIDASAWTGQLAIHMGVIGHSASIPGVSAELGATGDTFIYATDSANGLNIINKESANPTQDYIRFYAGQDANGTTPDIHIQGDGGTRGNIGFGTINPTAKLDLVGSFKYTDGNQQNGYVLTSDASGNATWQVATGGFSGNTSATCISDIWVSNIHSCSPLYVNPFDEGNILIGSSTGSTAVGIGVTGVTSGVTFENAGNALIKGNRIIHSDIITPSDITTLDTLTKGMYTEFNYPKSGGDFGGIVGYGASNTSTSGSSLMIVGNLSTFPTQNLGFLAYYGSDYLRGGTPTVGADFYKNKMVLKGGDAIDGLIINPKASDQSATIWVEMDGNSVMQLKGDGGGQAYLGLSLNSDGTETPSSNLQIGGTGTTGTFQYRDGNQTSGYVLTSDASGNATWQVAPSGSFTGNTSATCITDLWITNLHGCSPITIHDEVQANGSTATGTLSFAFGNGVTASGNNSFVAGGRANVASGLYSYAEGFNTSATGSTSHAEGQDTVASGIRSHAEGNSTTASEDSAHAEGQSTTSSGVASHAEGNGTTASNAAAHAEGFGGTASGAGSHAEGFGTLASGDYSHAEGSATSATTFYAHAAGRLTLVNATGGYASGNNNEITTISDYSAIIGGTDNIIDSNFGVGGTAYDSFIGAGLNNEIREANYSFIGAGENNFLTSPHSAIVGGKDNTINGLSDYSVMLGGSGNTISSNSSRTVVLGGTGISATTSDTVYVPDLVIDGLTSVTDLQTDSTGRVIDGASDITLKDNIKTITNPLETILKLNPVSFEWKPEINLRPGKVYGLIAQEVKEIIPEIVRERAKGDGTLTLDYKEIVPWLIGAIQELSGDNSPLLNREELILETQTIASEDNNIELNFNGNTESAIDGGITVIKGIDDNTNSEFKINSNGDWITNNYIIPFGMVIPKYTPGSTSDKHGKLGEITRDDSYIYIKTESGWLRSNLETF